jgi:hypothetical protein
MKRSSHLLSEKQLAALGSLVVESAFLESLVDDLIQELSRLRDEQYALFTSRAMLAAKLDLLLQLGTMRLRSKRRQTKFSAIIIDLKTLNTERTTAVHGIWEPIYDKGTSDVFMTMSLIPIIVPRKVGARARHARGGKVSGLSAERLDIVAQKISDGAQALRNFSAHVWTRRKNVKRLAKALLKSRE